MAEVPKELIPQRHHKLSVSATSLAKSESSTARSHKAAASTIKTVVTAPPWARDEPPSPTEESGGMLSPSLTRRPSDPRRSDVNSFKSSEAGDAPPSRWWAFAPQNQAGPSSAGPRAAPPVPDEDDEPTPTQQSPLRTFVGLTLKERSKSWLDRGGGNKSARNSEDGGGGSRSATPHVGGKGKEPGMGEVQRPVEIDRGLTIRLPAPSANPTTMHHNATPGWQSPWAPRLVPARAGDPEHDYWNLGNGHGDHADGTDQNSSDQEKLTGWAKRRKDATSFLLNNVYVPLLFRFVCITFTAAALAMAIRIRALEKSHHILGAVGSSPILVIIFAPITLVHVMAAVYLEYFGRPLGLWRTSHKLAHTLFEVLFICAWSAALALSFDNYFTSYLPCTSRSSIDWFSELPRPEMPAMEGTLAERICDDQLILISLVFIGLIMYCTNLVISLFRIFEKVKYHIKHGRV